MAPLLWWVRGGGGWGGRLLARPRVCAGGGVGWGGPFGPLAMPLVGRGGGAGAAWRPLSRGPPSARGSRPAPAPPIESWMPAQALAGALTSPAVAARRRPAGLAVGVSGQWLAGCGAAGSSPRLSPPHSLPREAARPRTSCHTVGGSWVRGPIPPPNPPVPAVWAFTCAAACVGAGAAAAAGCAGGSASGRGRYAKPGGASCWRPHP